jgi:hypothetical protein
MLTDARTSEPLWTQQFEEIEPLQQQTPEGLAAALSTAMARIAAHVVPVVASFSDRQAHLHGERTAPTAARGPR